MFKNIACFLGFHKLSKEEYVYAYDNGKPVRRKISRHGTVLVYYRRCEHCNKMVETRVERY